ncbi:zinc finger CCCH domain-containing protein 40-like, partial [Trifolium pratense]
ARAGIDYESSFATWQGKAGEMWGRPQTAKSECDGSDHARQRTSVAHSGLMPHAVISQQQNQYQTQGGMFYYNNPPPPQQEESYYPSMDPQRMGALLGAI